MLIVGECEKYLQRIGYSGGATPSKGPAGAYVLSFAYDGLDEALKRYFGLRYDKE